jgi:uncharacterized membrane protein YoaK (UPF0700 family)
MTGMDEDLKDRENRGMQADPVRSEIRVTVVMFALTVTAGAVDAVTFLGLGRAFAALATGNVLLLSFGVANAPGIPIGHPAEALAAFMAGVAAAHALILPVARRGRRWYVIALAGEVAVIAATGVYAVIVSGTGSLPEHDRTLAVVLLAAAMGWRSRVMVEAAIPDMPTTAVQVSLAKALADVLAFRSGSARAPGLVRARRAATVLGVFTGGVTGALLLRLGPGPALLCIAGFEAVVAAAYSRAPRLRPPEVVQSEAPSTHV